MKSYISKTNMDTCDTDMSVQFGLEAVNISQEDAKELPAHQATTADASKALPARVSIRDDDGKVDTISNVASNPSSKFLHPSAEAPHDVKELPAHQVTTTDASKVLPARFPTREEHDNVHPGNKIATNAERKVFPPSVQATHDDGKVRTNSNVATYSATKVLPPSAEAPHARDHQELLQSEVAGHNEVVYQYVTDIVPYSNENKQEFRKRLGLCTEEKTSDMGLIYNYTMICVGSKKDPPFGPATTECGFTYKGHSLGKGSFGEVKLAVDINTKKQHAVKEIDIGKFQIGEIDALYKLQNLDVSPAILLVQLVIERNRVLIHMEFLDGISIKDLYTKENSRLKTIKTLPGDRVLRKLIMKIYKEILSSLQKIHAAGWIHGDVQANNCMLVNKSSAIHVHYKIYLIDFGMAYKPPDEGAGKDFRWAGKVLKSLCCWEFGVEPVQHRKDLVEKVRNAGENDLLEILEHSKNINTEKDVDDLLSAAIFKGISGSIASSN